MLAAVLGVGAARGQEVFTGEERVTAIDLLVDFEPTVGKRMTTDRLVPKGLVPGDFEVRTGGEPRAVIAVEGPEEAEPWRTVVYFDLRLVRAAATRRAATLLGERAAELAALGSVEIVIADPVPRVALPATDDAGEIAGALAQIALFPEGWDALVSLRGELLAELEAAQEAELAPVDLLAAAVAEEVRIVRQAQDRLLAWLADTTGVPAAGAAAPRARRALFLVSAGYDLEPAAYYRSHLEAPAARLPDLSALTRGLGRALGAYGWVTFSLAPAAAPGETGYAVGRWDFRPVGVEYQEYSEVRMAQPEMYPGTGRQQEGEYFAGGLKAKLRERRDPKKADAYLELGQVLRRNGDLENARDAFKLAIHHFDSGRKTAREQAFAHVQLGAVLDALGEDEQATAAVERAHQLDAELAAGLVRPSVALRDPLVPLAVLAEETVGGVVQSADGLTAALAGLRRRVRLTYQVAGRPDGALRPLTLRLGRSGFQTRYPGWARSATPETVAAARLRRLLEEPGRSDSQGELELRLAWHPIEGRPAEGRPAEGRPAEGRPAEGGSSGMLAAVLELAPLLLEDELAIADAEPPREALLRVSVGFGGPNSVPAVAHRRAVRWQLGGQATWTWADDVDPGDEHTWIALLVEDLTSGRWGAAVIDISDHAM